MRLQSILEDKRRGVVGYKGGLADQPRHFHFCRSSSTSTGKQSSKFQIAQFSQSKSFRISDNMLSTSRFGSERTEILESPQSYWPPNSEMENGKFFNYNVAKFLKLVLILGVLMLLLGILCLIQAIYANSRRFYGIFCVLFFWGRNSVEFNLFSAWSNSHPSLPHQTSSWPSNCQKKVTLCMFSDYKIWRLIFPDLEHKNIQYHGQTQKKTSFRKIALSECIFIAYPSDGKGGSSWR